MRRRPLRVLYMIDHAGSDGGAERFVAGLAEHMPRDRVEPWVCSTRHGHDSAVRSLSAAGVPHLDLERTARWQIHRLARVVTLVRRERFDVLHAHKFGSNVWGSLIGRLCGVPVVIAHEHNWSYSHDRLRAWLDRRVVGRLSTRFVAVSRAGREQMIAIERVPPASVVVMPTAYIPHPREAGQDIRSELELGPHARVVASVANLRPEKALEVLIDAHALLLGRLGETHLVIAGEGDCRPQLERQIERLGLGRSVHLLGPRRDVDAIVRAADVGVMSSDWEGMPLFALECMAAGTPLVATAVGGLPEIVDDGRTGLLVPPRDPAALAAAVHRIFADTPLAGRLAREAARRSSDFTIGAVASKYADLYDQLVMEAA